MMAELQRESPCDKGEIVVMHYEREWLVHQFSADGHSGDILSRHENFDDAIVAGTLCAALHRCEMVVWRA